MKNLFPILFALSIALSCSEDDEVFFNEPNIDVQFFNIDSLVKVDDSLKVITDSILVLTDSLKIWNDSILVLNDTITNLTILIGQGQTDLEMNKNLFESYLTILSTNVVVYDKLDSTLDSHNTILSGTKSDIESGKIELSSIENIENGNVVFYEDSATLYSLPLSMTTDFSSYRLTIDNRTYELELDYKRVKEENDLSKIVVVAFDIAVKRHTFDSLKQNCNTTLCENDGVSLQVYF